MCVYRETGEKELNWVDGMWPLIWSVHNFNLFFFEHFRSDKRAIVLRFARKLFVCCFGHCLHLSRGWPAGRGPTYLAAAQTEMTLPHWSRYSSSRVNKCVYGWMEALSASSYHRVGQCHDQTATTFNLSCTALYKAYWSIVTFADAQTYHRSCVCFLLPLLCSRQQSTQLFWSTGFDLFANKKRFAIDL